MSTHGGLILWLSTFAVVVPVMAVGFLYGWSNEAMGTSFLGALGLGLTIGYAIEFREYQREQQHR